MPTPRGVVSWALTMLDELSRLPSTIAKARRLLVDLPERIEGLNQALLQTTAALETILPEVVEAVRQVDGRTEQLAGSLDDTKVVLEERLPDLTGLVTTLEERLEHMDGTVTNLGNVLVGALGSIPGMRRAVRNSTAAANGAAVPVLAAE